MGQWNFRARPWGFIATISGKMESDDEWHDLFNDFRNAIIKVKKPFNITTDVSKLQPFNGFGHATFKDIQTLLLSYGMVKNAKVITDDAITLWADIVGEDTGMIYKEKRFDNIEEAIRWVKE